MFFKKKPKNIKNNTDIFKVGTYLAISQSNDSNFSYSYKSKLDKIVNDTELILSVPIRNMNVIKLNYGTKYTIMFKTEKGILKNSIEVLSYHIKDNIPLMKVKLLGENTMLQRRDSFRLKTSLDFMFFVLDEQNTYDSDILTLKGRTIDISAGGMKFLSTEDIEDNKSIKVEIKQENLCFISLASIISKDIVTEYEHYKFCYKCKFENVPKKYKEELSKFIFDMQRKFIQKQ